MYVCVLFVVCLVWLFVFVVVFCAWCLFMFVVCFVCLCCSVLFVGLFALCLCLFICVCVLLCTLTSGERITSRITTLDFENSNGFSSRPFFRIALRFVDVVGLHCVRLHCVCVCLFVCVCVRVRKCVLGHFTHKWTKRDAFVFMNADLDVFHHGYQVCVLLLVCLFVCVVCLFVCCLFAVCLFVCLLCLLFYDVRFRFSLHFICGRKHRKTFAFLKNGYTNTSTHTHTHTHTHTGTHTHTHTHTHTQHRCHIVVMHA